jgi:hypothetical protein
MTFNLIKYRILCPIEGHYTINMNVTCSPIKSNSIYMPIHIPIPCLQLIGVYKPDIYEQLYKKNILNNRLINIFPFQSQLYDWMNVNNSNIMHYFMDELFLYIDGKTSHFGEGSISINMPKNTPDLINKAYHLLLQKYIKIKNKNTPSNINVSIPMLTIKISHTKSVKKINGLECLYYSILCFPIYWKKLLYDELTKK